MFVILYAGYWHSGVDLILKSATVEAQDVTDQLMACSVSKPSPLGMARGLGMAFTLAFSMICLCPLVLCGTGPPGLPRDNGFFRWLPIYSYGCGTFLPHVRILARSEYINSPDPLGGRGGKAMASWGLAVAWLHATSDAVPSSVPVQ